MSGVIHQTGKRTIDEPGWHVRGINPPSDFGPMGRSQAEQYYDMRRRGGAVGPYREFLIDADGKVASSEAEKAEK